MNWQTFLISFCEFLLALFLSWTVIFGTYSVFIRVWKDADFDVEDELRKDNAAVAIQFGTIMLCVALIVQQSIYPVIGILTVFLTGGVEGAQGPKMLLFAASHLLFGFAIAIGTIWAARRMFDAMNPHADEQAELRKGNSAIAVVMSGVLLVISMFLVDGVSSLTKSMIPQPSLGGLRDAGPPDLSLGGDPE